MPHALTNFTSISSGIPRIAPSPFTISSESARCRYVRPSSSSMPMAAIHHTAVLNLFIAKRSLVNDRDAGMLMTTGRNVSRKPSFVYTGSSVNTRTITVRMYLVANVTSMESNCEKLKCPTGRLFTELRLNPTPTAGYATPERTLMLTSSSASPACTSQVEVPPKAESSSE